MLTARKILIIVAGLVVIGIATVVILTKFKPNFRQGNMQLIEKTGLSEQRTLSKQEILEYWFPDATEDELPLLSNVRSIKSATEPAVLQQAEKVAQEGNIIEINNCRSSPLVLKAKKGGRVTFKNKSDIIPHEIVLEGIKYQLEPNGQLIVTTNFKNKSGLFPFACDDFSIRGFIYISP